MSTDRFMRRPEVLNMLQVSESTLYAMIRERRFPPGIGIGDRCVGWSRQRVTEWMQNKVNAADRMERMAG